MRQRVLTACAAIPLVVAIVAFQNPWPFAFAACLVAAICSSELSRLFRSDRRISSLLGLATVAALASVALGFPYVAGGILLGSLAALWRSGLPAWSAVYIGLPLGALVHLHGPGGPTWDLKDPVFMVLLPLWAGDTAGIFVGKAFGKHPLAPSISPKKTVEGAIGNFFASVLVAGLLANPLGIPLGWSIVCGVITGVLGQLGDLFESRLKRSADVKDSGGLLPGHGGLLDRIDSLLFTAVPVAACLAVALYR